MHTLIETFDELQFAKMEIMRKQSMWQQMVKPKVKEWLLEKHSGYLDLAPTENCEIINLEYLAIRYKFMDSNLFDMTRSTKLHIGGGRLIFFQQFNGDVRAGITQPFIINSACEPERVTHHTSIHPRDFSTEFFEAQLKLYLQEILRFYRENETCATLNQQQEYPQLTAE